MKKRVLSLLLSLLLIMSLSPISALAEGDGPAEPASTSDPAAQDEGGDPTGDPQTVGGGEEVTPDSDGTNGD